MRIELWSSILGFCRRSEAAVYLTRTRLMTLQVDRLLAWTPVERSVRLAGEFGAKVEVINEVLAQSANSG